MSEEGKQSRPTLLEALESGDEDGFLGYTHEGEIIYTMRGGRMISPPHLANRSVRYDPERRTPKYELYDASQEQVGATTSKEYAFAWLRGEVKNPLRGQSDGLCIFCGEDARYSYLIEGTICSACVDRLERWAFGS